jgi:hypothetical protein
VAGIAYGEPLLTHDIDVVVELDRTFAEGSKGLWLEGTGYLFSLGRRSFRCRASFPTPGGSLRAGAR